MLQLSTVTTLTSQVSCESGVQLTCVFSLEPALLEETGRKAHPVTVSS